MSLNGLNNTVFPLTIDGTTALDVSSLTIDGTNIDIAGLVPYTGATQTLDMGAQNIQTSHTPTAPNDVINLTTLQSAVTYVDTSVALTYLNKITTSSQTVAGQVTFNKPVIIDDSLTVNPTKTANLASVVDVSPNYKRAETDAGVTANYRFGSISNAGGIYTATTTGDFATLGLANLTADKLYKINLYVRAFPTATYTTSIQLYSSADGTNPAYSLNYSASYNPSSPNTFQLITGNFTVSTGYTKLILLCLNTNNPTYVTPVEWYGLELFDMGVALTNASMPSQTADRVLVLNTNKQVVASGINTTKLGYLDNVSSDIQTQLNAKLNLSGSNANQNIVIGSYKVQSSATPSTGDDYVNKTYADGLISGLSSIYLALAGGTMTGNITMNGNKITSTYTPVNADDLTRKGYVDGLITGLSSIYLALAGGTMTGNITMNGNKITSTYTPVNADDLTRKGYVDGKLALYLPLTGGTLTGALTVEGSLSILNRLLGQPDNTPSGNFWIGLRGSGTENERLAIAIVGADGTGIVSSVVISKTLNLSGLTASRVLTTDASKNVVASSVTTTTLGYLDATSSIQTQLNSKANASALASYLPLSGGTMTGDITMNNFFVNCSSDPSSNNQLTRKSYVDTLIAGRVPRTGDTSLVGDYATSGSITGAGLISTGGMRGSFYITSSSSITYNRVSDRGKWFKIINVGTSPNTYYAEFHITYAVAGEHAHIHFIVSAMYNASPSIKVLHSSIYGGSVVQYLRIALDNASIYYQGYVEMYLADYSWYEADIPIYLYGVNSSPINSMYSLVSTKTAGTSSGFSYYAVDTTVGFDMNYAGTRYKMANTIFYTNAPTTIDETLSTPARIAITNSDPGDLISKRYGSADRYGIGQYSSGTVRVFGSNGYTGTSIRFSRATDDVTSGTAGFTDLMTMRYNGVLDIKGGNGGDWAYQYLTRPGGLIIGRTDTNYGGEYQINNNNVAGFMMECADYTEIQIHDSGARLASFMYYYNNSFTIGRDSGYGVTSVVVPGQITTNGFLTVNNLQQITTGANQNFLSLYANSNNSTEYINLRFSHAGNNTYIQSYRTTGFWRAYLLFFTVNASGGSVQIAQMTDQGFQCFGSFYTAGNAWCGDSTTLGNGCSNFSQGWDRWLCYANGYSTAGGYAYYNQGNALGTISDSRIKRDFLRITEEQSVAFLKALEPTSFCLKEQQPFKRKRINEKGEEIEEEVTPAVCSCRQDGWVAQNVLEACEKSGASKSVVNNWYDYQQELLKPEEERKTLIGVSDRPILSHTVNVVKALMARVEVLEAREVMWEQYAREQEAKQKKMEERMEKMASLLSQLMKA